jgi:hypothetical protein
MVKTTSLRVKARPRKKIATTKEREMVPTNLRTRKKRKKRKMENSSTNKSNIKLRVTTIIKTTKRMTEMTESQAMLKKSNLLLKKDSLETRKHGSMMRPLKRVCSQISLAKKITITTMEAIQTSTSMKRCSRTALEPELTNKLLSKTLKTSRTKLLWTLVVELVF